MNKKTLVIGIIAVVILLIVVGILVISKVLAPKQARLVPNRPVKVGVKPTPQPNFGVEQAPANVPLQPPPLIPVE